MWDLPTMDHSAQKGTHPLQPLVGVPQDEVIHVELVVQDDIEAIAGEVVGDVQ